MALRCLYLCSTTQKTKLMKKYIVIILIPFLFSCGRADKEKAAALQAKNDSLVSQTVQKDAAITDFMKSVNDIEGVLDSIKTKENILNKNTQTSGELKVSDKDRIKSDISSIYALMLKDKQQLAALSGKLKSSGLKLNEFQKLVDLDALYAASDYITLHVASTPETQGMLSRSAFERMKQGAQPARILSVGPDAFNRMPPNAPMLCSPTTTTPATLPPRGSRAPGSPAA